MQVVGVSYWVLRAWVGLLLVPSLMLAGLILCGKKGRTDLSLDGQGLCEFFGGVEGASLMVWSDEGCSWWRMVGIIKCLLEDDGAMSVCVSGDLFDQGQR